MFIDIRLQSVKCTEERNESSASEEAYLLVTTADLRPLPNGLPHPPDVRVIRYGVWEDVDEDEVFDVDGPAFWGMDGAAADLRIPDDAAFVLTMMENDNADPEKYQVVVQAAAVASLGASIADPPPNRALRLTDDIRTAVDGANIPYVTDDDHIGTQRLVLDPTDIVPFGETTKRVQIENAKGHYELVFRIRSRDFSQARGNPSLVQSTFGTKGNFDLVVPVEAGGFSHYFRDNDDPQFPWRGPTRVAALLPTVPLHVDAVSLIQGNFGQPGNLEVVARIGDRLAHFWRGPAPGFQWSGPFFFGEAGVVGTPALVQSRVGQRGHFDVVVPLARGGLAHYRRDNDDPTFPWRGPNVFASVPGVPAFRFDDVSLVQTNYGTPGNLEVVARMGERLFHLWCDATHPESWSAPSSFGEANAAGNPVLVQGRFGTKGNFEVVVPLVGAGLGHYWRDNDDPRQIWHGPTRFGELANGRVAKFDAVALVQGNFGTPGNLEVVARIGDRLAHFWRDCGPDFRWNGPFFFA